MTDVSSEHSPCMFCGSRYCDRMKCYDNADHPLQEVSPVACPVCQTNKVKPGNICWECATKIIDGEW